jgi:hypothetical protein
LRVYQEMTVRLAPRGSSDETMFAQAVLFGNVQAKRQRRGSCFLAL